ncbi:MAG: hypothetical protein IPK72_04000 [Candidatus Eisenbacteria bacterium]|nr:hypothetical protein [Candidatus Eisenbacteria bacterium]
MSETALTGLSGFARGYLLAADRLSNSGPDAVAAETARLEPGRPEIETGLNAWRALPEDECSALAREWLLSEPVRSCEDALDLHWSWLPPALEGERPALLVLLLNSLRPESAREILRSLWNELRNIPSRHLEAKAPSPQFLAALRRRFFAAFALVPPRPGSARDALIQVGRKELHLFLQELGLTEIGNAAGPDLPSTLQAQLALFDGVDATRVSRLLKRTNDEVEPARRMLARRHLGRALSAAGPNGDLVVLTALDHLGLILTQAEPEEARFLAQRLPREQGAHLLACCEEWRDDVDARTGASESIPVAALETELLRRLTSVIARAYVPTVEKRVWA